MRIVSLIASSTEIVCALGLRSFLIGRSHECDYPESVAELPVCTAPKFNIDGTSYSIDERVRAILQESLSVYRVDSEILRRLRPTHIITQSQCEVCAVSLKDVQAAVREILDFEAQIISLQPDSLDDIYADIERVAAALSAEEAADALLVKMRRGISEIRERSNEAKTRPRMALIEWIDPLMSAGNWMPELVESSGAENLFGENGKHSSVMSWSEVLEADPDIVVISPCGFSISATLAEMPTLVRKSGFAELSAVKKGKVYVADGNQYFNRPGPRVLESLQILAEIAHPELFDFGLKGKGWMPYPI